MLVDPDVRHASQLSCFQPCASWRGKPPTATSIGAAAEDLPKDLHRKHKGQFRELLVSLLHPRAEERMTADAMERLIWLQDAAKDEVQEISCCV